MPVKVNASDPSCTTTTGTCGNEIFIPLKPSVNSQRDDDDSDVKECAKFLITQQIWPCSAEGGSGQIPAIATYSYIAERNLLILR